MVDPGEQGAWTMVTKISNLIEERDALVAERDKIAEGREIDRRILTGMKEAAEAERDRLRAVLLLIETDTDDLGYETPAAEVARVALEVARVALGEDADEQVARAEAAEAEVKRIKDAARWLIDNRGHRGEEQAWKLLENALTDD